jgi:glucosyl-dolichyl phosphate glucuronosyltransferase
MHDGQGSAELETKPINSVTVVICAYTDDRWETLRRAIDAAVNQMRPGDDLLVVVDHNDALLSRCQNYLDVPKVVPNCYRRGLSGARNTALDRADGSIIVFLDDDAVPLSGWLDSLRAPYTDERVYGVGGYAKPRWIGSQPKWLPDEFLWVVGCSHKGLPAARRPIRNPVGANMSFRKAAFSYAGGFVESLGRIGERANGCEETEFAIRLALANPDATILYEPSSQVEHHVARRRASLDYFVRRCWAEGLSKAEVSRRVGPSNALSVERGYTMRVLPRGIWKGLTDSATGDLWGAMRSATIVVGLSVTTVGFCVGTLFRRHADGNAEKSRSHA